MLWDRKKTKYGSMRNLGDFGPDGGITIILFDEIVIRI
jgi:hypothetical protein